MFKVLVTGAKGQVGTELVKTVPSNFTVIGLGSDQLDITDRLQLEAVMAEHKPDLIINSAAYTAVDKAESDIENAYKINEKGVVNLALAAKDADIPLFHISTDYVFDGQSNTPYKETDPVNPQSVYGSSKLAGEIALAKYIDKHIILRTSWVFGASGNNFVKTMLRLAKERDELSVVADQYGCPTSAKSISAVLWKLVTLYFKQGELPWGAYHFSNIPSTSWYQYSQSILKHARDINVLSRNTIVKPINTCDYPAKAKRPYNSSLDCSKLELLVGSPCPSWSDELIQLLKTFKY